MDGDRRCGDRRGQHSLRNRVARLLDREALEDVAPAQKEPGGGIGKNHFSGAQPLALGDSRFFQINQTSLGSSDQQAVMREGVAQRAQSIAIQLRSHKLAIRENQAAGPSQGSLCCESAVNAPRTSRESKGSFSKAGGTIASMASSDDRPSSSRSSKPLSKLAESLTFSSRRGNQGPTVSRERISRSLARSQRRLETIVLISPLCATYRNGCARCQEGCVFVE